MRHRTKKHKIKYTKRIQKTKNKLKFSKYKGKKTKKHKKTNKTKKIRKGGTRPIREKRPPTRYAEEFASNTPITKTKAKPKKKSKAKPKKESEDKPKRKPNFYFYYKRLREGRLAKREALKNIERIKEKVRERELDKAETLVSRLWDYDEEEPGEPIGPIKPIFTIRNTVKQYIDLYNNAFPIGELKIITKNEFKDILFVNILQDYESANIFFTAEEKALLRLDIDKSVNRMPDEKFKTNDINLTPEKLENIKKLYNDIMDEEDEDSSSEEDEDEDEEDEDEDEDVEIILHQSPEEEEEE